MNLHRVQVGDRVFVIDLDTFFTENQDRMRMMCVRRADGTYWMIPIPDDKEAPCSE